MSDQVRELIDSLRTLRREAGATQNSGSGFWGRLASSARKLCLAELAMLVELAEPEPILLGEDSQPGMGQHSGALLVGQPWLRTLLERAERNDFAASPPGGGDQDFARIAVRLSTDKPLFLVFLVGEQALPRLNELLVRAQLIADIPSDVSAPSQSGTGKPTALGYLDLLAETYAAKRFSTAAYGLVNGLVGHSPEIDQAVLGWREGAYLRVKAISHFDRFEKKTELVKSLEAAMEEAADQGQSIHYGEKLEAESGTIVLAHRQLQVQTHCRDVFSLTFGSDGFDQDQAVILILSHNSLFSDSLMESLHFVGNIVYPQLVRLKEKEDGIHLRALRGMRRGLTWAVGPEHVWAKFFAMVLAGLVLYGVLGTLPHRVEGTATLTTDSIRLVSAPFDGRIDHVHASVGDTVDERAILALMDTEDLLLQRAELQADLQRNMAEVSRARAAFDLVESEVAAARVAQNQARLARLDVYLAQGEVRAPFEGIIVEGERQDLLGLPVSKGQALYRIARVEDMYLQIDVRQEDIHFVNVGDRGEFVFLSQPDRKLPFEVTRIIPMGHVRDSSGAVFELKADLQSQPELWWRPGMSGVAKVDKGRRNVLWVIGHRLMNRLRLWLWW